jgi:hypothetical protein
MLAVSPHDLEPALTDLVLPVLHATDGGEVQHDVTHVLTGLGRHAGPLGPLGRAALAAALTAGRADHRVLAVDAVTAFAGTGRLDAADLAAAMASVELAATPGRWAGALADLALPTPARTSPTCSPRCCRPCPGTARWARAGGAAAGGDGARGGRVRDPALHGWLDAVPGRGRAARAARTLAGL